MPRLIFITLSFFILFIDSESIPWNEGYRLVWRDFKAKPRFDMDEVALTVSGISFSYSLTQKDNEDLIYALVEAHFYPEKSWFKIDEINDFVLSHEQLHFDITELYARKFRKCLNEIQFTENIKTQLKDINKVINLELEAVQDQYDKETRHSMNENAQNYWEEYIQLELEKHKEFVNASY